MRIAHFVVVPCQNLDLGAGSDHGGAGIHDGGAGIAAIITRYQRSSFVPQNAGEGGALAGLLEQSIDFGNRGWAIEFQDTIG